MSTLATLPRIAVEVSGNVLADATLASLEELRVQHRLSQPSLCELKFVNPKAGIEQEIVAGSELQVAVGERGERVFSGQITALEYSYDPSHNRAVRVRAYDLLHRLRKRYPVRVHVQITTAGLANELVADLGLSVEAEDAGPLWPKLVQYNRSDFQLLAASAEASGLYLAMRGDVLHLITLSGIGEPVPLSLGDSLFEANIEINGDEVCRSVQASGWDPLRVERREGRATSARVGRAIAAQVLPTDVGGSEEITISAQTVTTDQHAEALAQAELDLRAAREVVLWGTAEGNAGLLAGSRVRVDGIARTLCGDYVLTSVNHLINRRSGFISEFSTVPPARRAEGAAGLGIELGIVSSVDDPDGLGRVRVTLASMGNLETDWLEVLAVGAGKSKGLVSVPDVDDHVLVLFPGHNPALGVVIGGLYGTQGPPDYGVDGHRVRRCALFTPAGHKLVFDDVKKSVHMEDTTGSFVELSPQKLRIHAAVDLEISAPNRAVVISGKTVDFRRA